MRWNSFSLERPHLSKTAGLKRAMSRTACWVLGLVMAASLPTASLAEEAEEGTFSFVLENDLFNGIDQDYTNGIQISWTSGPDAVPDMVLRHARLFPLFPSDGTVRVNYALSQNMYTPTDIRLENPPEDDRPYAGWLNASVGLTSQNGHQLDQLQLQVGVVGPASLAEEAQTIVHDIIDADEPRGWDTQLKNEPGIVLTYQRSWRAYETSFMDGAGFDVTPHAGGALGNVFTYLNMGATVRAGWNLPDDYGPPRIQPSLPASGFLSWQDRLGVFAFAGLDGRAIARNIFLDGNTFRDSRRVDKFPLVADAQIGVAVTYRSLRFAYSQVLRSKEFEGQDGGDQFGAVSISMRF